MTTRLAIDPFPGKKTDTEILGSFFGKCGVSQSTRAKSRCSGMKTRGDDWTQETVAGVLVTPNQLWSFKAAWRIVVFSMTLTNSSELIPCNRSEIG
jgi:hypothetical protein